MKLKARRQGDLRHVHIVQTIRLLAYLTEEMGMLILVVVVVMTVAEFVARPITAALDGMHEMVLTEQRQGTEMPVS